ncbi:hypothetical protein, partial [Escherichia coli]|uniref:hypothetical protein n=1 Tax=Escherichia coli TaxID=562 RepID=UPI0039DFB7FC
TDGNQCQNGSRQAVSDFCVHGYLSGFIGSESLDMLNLQPASGRTLAFFLMAEIYLTISVED